MWALVQYFTSLVQASFIFGKKDVDFFSDAKITSLTSARKCMGFGFNGPFDLWFFVCILAFPNVRREGCGWGIGVFEGMLVSTPSFLECAFC